MKTLQVKPRQTGWTARRATPLALAAGALILLGGCEVEPESHVVSAPPPGSTVPVATVSGPVRVVVPATVGAAGTVVLTQAPPVSLQPQVVIARPPRPSPEDVWLDGHWTWRDGQYEWVNAHWEAPPSDDSTWTPPRWEQRSDGYYTFYEGHWN